MRLALVTIVVGLLLFAREASACSCGVGPPRLLSPVRHAPAVLNAKIRIAVATHWMPKPGDRVEIRTVDGGSLVPVVEHRMRLGDLDVFDLTPRAPLAKNTRYAVALVRTDQKPSTWVFGSFRTGTEVDHQPPSLAPLGKVVTGGGGSMFSMCDTSDVYANVFSVAGSDAGRASARLLYGVWIGDPAGKIDATKPPTGLLELEEGGWLAIGNADLCNMLKFPFPARRDVVLGIAAVDEAGNKSAIRAVRVRLPRTPSPPP